MSTSPTPPPTFNSADELMLMPVEAPSEDNVMPPTQIASEDEIPTGNVSTARV